MATATAAAPVPILSSTEEVGQPAPVLVPFDAAAYQRALAGLPPALVAQVEPRIATACECFGSERHYDVLQLLNEVLGVCTAAGASAAPFTQFLQASLMYTTSTRRAADCNALVQDIEDSSRWQKISVDAKGCGTFYREDKTNGHHYFKTVGELAVNPISLCGTIMEIDLYPEWFPRCTAAQCKGNVSRFHTTGHIVMGAPWPLSNRDAFIEGYGIDDLDKSRRLVIVAHSLYEDQGPLPAGVRAPSSLADTVRCDMYGGFLIQMQSPTLVRVSFVMSIDPKVASIPQAGVNWMSGMVMWQMMDDIQKATTRGMEPGSKYWKRRRDRPEVYEQLRTRYNAIIKPMVDATSYERLSLKEDF